MTRNQIAYQTLIETMRNNRAVTEENKRHNVASETETGRSNLARETETNRHNVRSEALDQLKSDREYETTTKRNQIQSAANEELARHNLIAEQIATQQNIETARRNKAAETETQRHNEQTELAERMNQLVQQRGQDVQQGIAELNAANRLEVTEKQTQSAEKQTMLSNASRESIAHSQRALERERLQQQRDIADQELALGYVTQGVKVGTSLLDTFTKLVK